QPRITRGLRRRPHRDSGENAERHRSVRRRHHAVVVQRQCVVRARRIAARTRQAAPITNWSGGRRIRPRRAAAPLFILRKAAPSSGRKLADFRRMAVILLVLFPFLLLFYTPLAWVAMAIAIGLICQKQFSAPRR